MVFNTKYNTLNAVSIFLTNARTWIAFFLWFFPSRFEPTTRTADCGKTGLDFIQRF